MKLAILFGMAILFSACTTQMPITSFEECLDAGYPVMESYPRQCNDGTNTFIEPTETKQYVSADPQECTLIKFMCEEGKRPFFDDMGCGCTNLPEDSGPKACTREYMPVCGEVQVQCVTTPCDPIKTTFSNRCEAENANAMNLVEGACEDEINLEGSCLSFDGTWIADANECENMPQSMCEDLGGTFNECASACRNDPDAEICTMQCVQVCQFN